MDFPKRSIVARRCAIAHRLRSDAAVEVIEVGHTLFDQALNLYESRRDKEWGMTDCISFVVMRSRAIVEALMSDIHSQQTGFRALLRDE